MLTPHESLVVSKERGLLVSVAGNAALAPGVVDIYDISQDCRQPVLKSSRLLTLSRTRERPVPDGKTFYVASPGTPTLTAVDISDPEQPRVLKVMPYSSHGLSISADGNRAYLAGVGLSGSACAFAVTCALPDPDARPRTDHPRCFRDPGTQRQPCRARDLAHDLAADEHSAERAAVHEQGQALPARN